MACSNPLPLYKNERLSQYTDLYHRYFDTYIPCGRCLNCRVDKINQYTHRCESELIKRRSGAFVTFTYDDYHIQPLLRKDSKNNTVATLSRSDCKHFLDRLNKIIHKQQNNILCQHDYKYIIAGEYGDHGKIFNRPHFHALFFGLDYAFCKKLFAQAWQGRGSIKVLPIMSGAPRYLLDYITTLEYGEIRKIKYENNNIEPPFQTHSLGLGSDLYYKQLDYIKTHNNCYKWHGKDVPIPPYWRDKFLLPKTNPLIRYNKIKTIAKNSNIHINNNLSTIDQINILHNFQLSKSKIRESNLTKKQFQNGRSIINTEKISYDLHNYKQKTDLFYRACHPTLSDLNLTPEEAYNIACNTPQHSINQLVDIALYGDLVPF